MSRNPGFTRPRRHDTHIIEAMQIRIRDKMYHTEDASKRFIGQQELRALWVDLELRRVFPSHSWEDHEIRTIQRYYLKVLSILVMIAWPGVCSNDKSGFREGFFQRPYLADRNLPLASKSLSFLNEHAINFRERQSAFCPVTIEERRISEIQKVAADRPLPFTEEESPLGEGASGKVKRVVIAREGFRSTEDAINVKVCGDIKPLRQTSNETDRCLQEMHVACKTFHIDSRAKNFRREFRRLGWIKRAKEDIRIMKHLAALEQGDNVMILLPMAEHFDLDVFLRQGFKPTRDTEDAKKLYDFDTSFPNLKEDDLSAALVNELCQIAAALQWLHEGNEASDTSYSSLAHMDLKPENILVAGDPGSLIGKWMLSDFGVSLFSRSKEVTRGQSSRTSGSSYLDEPRRGCGSYQPPEIKHERIDGRKCDVWSFGCILVDVLAFALGRKDLFHEVRGLRNCGEDDYFYQTNLIRTDTQTPINNVNTKLKTGIRRWLKDQRLSGSRPRWVRYYIDILESALKCDPHDRQSIGFIVNALSDLRQGKATAIQHSICSLVHRS